MTNPTDGRLPFLDKYGTLFLAPLGSELPDHRVRTVDSSGQTEFAMSWPASWLQPLPALTDDTGQVIGVVMTVPGECRVYGSTWSFGRRVADIIRGRFSPQDWTKMALPYPVRMMFGWESEDCRDRVVAPQVYFDDDWAVHLEQPHTVYLAGRIVLSR